MKDGSYSVEAAIIMPMVIIIMLAFLLFGFYLRDIVFTEAFARNLILATADDTGETADISVTAGELQSALWCAKVRQLSVSDGKNKTVVKYKLTAGFDFLDIPVENTLSKEKSVKTAEKILQWKVLTDMAKDLFTTEDK